MEGYTHSGEIGGFITVYVYVPDLELSITMCCNALNISTNQILKEVMMILGTEF